MKSVFIGWATLVFDAYLFDLFYELYKTAETCLKSLREAQSFEINSELPEKIKSCGGVVPYAVVSGNVKALSASLKSQYFSSVRGVIRQNKMLNLSEWTLMWN
ncbi:mitochondrial ubiquitin ligase activator of nfkb 1-like [Stegodyphus dumicola]|uniref:mitochondrial ubiquitin ligase activator of nfkb 1-like n=1 Tax=Stegodyphus dumicola TaxID=202533 RepID=UPI0015B290A3|nr:mitochondrial ubiquitin ligase activator of nfkb 1-like [Stegodyphus dumicola]